MREIKFRAYSKEKKAFIAGFNMVNFHSYFNAGLEPSIYRYDRKWLLSEVELMQSTGLKCKNGHDIYEGDVIQTIGSEGTKIRHEIVFDDGSFCARNLRYQNIGKLTQKWISELEFEVVGDIYTSPELLKP